jgi:hypothetical protein
VAVKFVELAPAAKAVPYVLVGPVAVSVNGAWLTVLDGTATFTLVAPVVLTTVLPENVPAAVAAANLIYIVVEATVPLDGVKETVLVNVVLLILTSKPDGGVTTRFPLRLVPETEKFCDADVVPYVVLKAANDPVSEMTGAAEVVKFTGLFVPVPVEYDGLLLLV